MIIPTIFSWFFEWIKKIFKDFLKTNLKKLNEGNGDN